MRRLIVAGSSSSSSSSLARTRKAAVRGGLLDVGHHHPRAHSLLGAPRQQTLASSWSVRPAVFQTRPSRMWPPARRMLSSPAEPAVPSGPATASSPSLLAAWRGWKGRGVVVLATSVAGAAVVMTRQDEDDRHAPPRKQLSKGVVASRIEDEVWGLDRVKLLWSRLSQAEKLLVPLIATNVLVFLAWRSPSPRVQAFMRANFFCSPLHLKAKLYHTTLTSAFSHISLMHLAFNMTALWTIVLTLAPSVINILGVEKFSMMYVAGAIVSSLVGSAWQLKRGVCVPSLGASGALMATLWVFVSAFPDNEMALIFLPFVPIPAFRLAAGFALFDIIGALRGWQVLDHAAHLGGAAVGLATFYGLRELNALEKWNEYGTKVLPGGHVYEGHFRLGRMHGQGRLVFADGIHVYQGEFKNNKIEGYGEYSNKRTGAVYKGQLKSGAFHGVGVYHGSDGSVYRGEWANGRQEGKGTLLLQGREDGVKYVGNFKADRFHGHGQLVQGDAVIFDGEFEDTTDGRWRAVGTLYPTGGQPTKVVWVENENPVEAL